MKLRPEFLYFTAGLVVAVIIFTLCKPKEQPKNSNGITPPAVETVRVQVIKWKPIQAETIRKADTIIKGDTVYITRPVVLQWKEYRYEDKEKRLSITIEADTIRRISVLLMKPHPAKEMGVLVSTSSVTIYTLPTANLMVGAGWNFENKRPEVIVGVRLRF